MPVANWGKESALLLPPRTGSGRRRRRPRTRATVLAAARTTVPAAAQQCCIDDDAFAVPDDALDFVQRPQSPEPGHSPLKGCGPGSSMLAALHIPVTVTHEGVPFGWQDEQRAALPVTSDALPAPLDEPAASTTADGSLAVTAAATPQSTRSSLGLTLIVSAACSAALVPVSGALCAYSGSGQQTACGFEAAATALYPCPPPAQRSMVLQML